MKFVFTGKPGYYIPVIVLETFDIFNGVTIVDSVDCFVTVNTK